MSIDPAEIIRELAALQPPPGDESTPISVPALVRAWLARGPAIFDGDDRVQLDELCRQIDVRKRVSAGYAAGWKRLDPEAGAPPEVVAGVVGILLANAADVGAPGTDGSINDGWGLKCTNSALKALDTWPGVPVAETLRAWATDVLGRVLTPGPA